MLKCFEKIDWKKTGIFAGGVLFGTAGIKVLSSKDAKKVYTSCTAAFLRAKECVMNTVSTVQENAGDIYAGAKEINEERQRHLQMQRQKQQRRPRLQRTPKNKILIRGE